VISVFVVVVAIVLLGAWQVTQFNHLEKIMSAAADRISAAFDDFKADVSAKFTALEAKVTAAQSLSDADAAPILADIAAAKAAVDATPTDGTPATTTSTS
jgi:predicted negative regulator of RcsB-dependent stress response